MIQFNLLPDVKIDYIKAKRSKQKVMTIATLVAGASFAIFLLLFVTVNVLQKNHSKNLSADIKTQSQKLKDISELDKILTVQNQLTKLPELHDGKPILSRMKDYLPLVTPASVSYSSIDIDTAANTMTFTGSADSIKTINQFVDTLKFTKYVVGESSDQTNAFSNVVLVSFSKTDDKNKGANYSITLKYDPAIFSTKSEVKLQVPNIITTRSATERPNENLIQPQGSTSGDGTEQ